MNAFDRPKNRDDSIYGLRTSGRLPSGSLQHMAVIYMTMILVSLTTIGSVAVASLV